MFQPRYYRHSLIWVRWLDGLQEPAMVIGGVAASFLGRPRLTQDIDALVLMPGTRWTDALAAAQTFGIVPRIEGALDFARRSRVLLLHHSQSKIATSSRLSWVPHIYSPRSPAHDRRAASR